MNEFDHRLMQKIKPYQIFGWLFTSLTLGLIFIGLIINSLWIAPASSTYLLIIKMNWVCIHLSLGGLIWLSCFLIIPDLLTKS